MNFERAGVYNLINLNFNPDILTEEEVKKSLEDAGVDIKSIEQKFIQFEKKLTANYQLECAGKKREEFDNNLEALKNECSEIGNEDTDTIYKLAARNKTELNANDLESDLLDIKMMEVLKRKGKI